jgi:hypothetical protein
MLRICTICIAMMQICMVAVIGGCAERGVIEPAKPVTISVPVAVGCVDGVRPDAVPALNTEFSVDAWAALTPRQKAALVAAQGLKHQSRAEGLDAATGGCR